MPSAMRITGLFVYGVDGSASDDGVEQALNINTASARKVSKFFIIYLDCGALLGASTLSHLVARFAL